MTDLCIFGKDSATIFDKYSPNMSQNKETKSDKFKRIATLRVNNILRRIKSLGNLSNKSQYDYTEAEVRKMFSAVDRELRMVKDRFTSSKNGDGFSL